MDVFRSTDPGTTHYDRQFFGGHIVANILQSRNSITLENHVLSSLISYCENTGPSNLSESFGNVNQMWRNSKRPKYSMKQMPKLHINCWENAGTAQK